MKLSFHRLKLLRHESCNININLYRIVPTVTNSLIMFSVSEIVVILEMTTSIATSIGEHAHICGLVTDRHSAMKD